MNAEKPHPLTPEDRTRIQAALDAGVAILEGSATDAYGVDFRPESSRPLLETPFDKPVDTAGAVDAYGGEALPERKKHGKVRTLGRSAL